MYIRASSQVDKKTKQVYTTYKLVESYRNQNNDPRQRTLLNLGCHFSIEKAHCKLLADRIEEICYGQQSLFPLEPILEEEAQRIAKRLLQTVSKADATTEKAEKKSKPNIQNVDVNSIQHQHTRKIGAEHVGYHAACQLKLSDILNSVGFNQKQIHAALGSIIGRLIHPGSELSTHHYLTTSSALDELMGTDFSALSLKAFYQVADKLLKNKVKIEQALYQREKDLFQFQETITLYDITNTYFEGRCETNVKARHGRSKEKRNDCPLVALGMVLDGSGFPKKTEVFPGNISEPSTLEQMIAALKGDKKAIVVLDAGFASEKNIAWLTQHHYHYIVVSRKAHQGMPEDKTLVTVKENKNNLVQVALVNNEQTNEIELYCHSKAKQAKTHQMVSKASDAYELELTKLAEGLHKKGTVKNHEKVMGRLGRLKEKYKKVSKHYTITVAHDEQHKNATQVSWDKQLPEHSGVYCLRTNRKDLDEKTLWHTYTMLTEIEAAFRSLKSELGLRPIYHQKEARIDAHLFISIIAYHLLHTIRYQLKAQGINQSWQTLRDEILDTHVRLSTTLDLEDGRVLNIRKTVNPDTHQSTIYRALGIDSNPGKTQRSYL